MALEQKEIGARHQRALGRQVQKTRRRAAAYGVRDQSDAVAALSLSAREVDHMAKQPSDRRAQNMQDVEGTVCRHLKFQSLLRIYACRNRRPAGKGPHRFAIAVAMMS